MIKIITRKKAIWMTLFAGFWMVQSSSCTKFLEVQPRDYMFEEEAFATPKGVESVLNGIYQSLTDPVLYGNMLTMDAIENLAQYYYAETGEFRRFLTSFRYNESNTKRLFDKIWQQAYLSIIGVNSFCTHLEDSSFHVLDPEEKKLLLGEAYALRAFLHFDQLRLFGPVYTIAPNQESIPYVRQAHAEVQPLLSASDVITEILRDLDSALVLLEKDPVRSTGVNKVSRPVVGESIAYLSNRHRRMNYFAVKTLQARVLLYAGKNAEAWDVVNSVILAQEAFFPWQTEQQMASDPVFSRESFFGIENRNVYTHYRQLFSPLLSDDQIYTPTPLRLNGIYNPNSTDLRLKYWFKEGLEGDKTYKVFVKYSDVTINDVSIRYYQPLIRKSELYLMAAETAPDLEQGIFYLNTLRVNRGLPPVDFESASTRSDLLTAIRDEYQREFVGEGQTFFMFKRFNMATIPAVTGKGTKNMTEVNYVVPLPEDEMYYR